MHFTNDINGVKGQKNRPILEQVKKQIVYFLYK